MTELVSYKRVTPQTSSLARPQMGLTPLSLMSHARRPVRTCSTVPAGKRDDAFQEEIEVSQTRPESAGASYHSLSLWVLDVQIWTTQMGQDSFSRDL